MTNEVPQLPIKNSLKARVFTSQFIGKVLVVEDYLPNQRITKMMLEKMGCTIDIASSGREALEKIKENSYDLVLMDCQMPEMDGFETTRLIRVDATTRHLIVVAMTANVFEGAQEQCLIANMDGYISKPIHYKDLEKIFHQYLLPAN